MGFDSKVSSLTSFLKEEDPESDKANNLFYRLDAKANIELEGKTSTVYFCGNLHEWNENNYPIEEEVARFDDLLSKKTSDSKIALVEQGCLGVENNLATYIDELAQNDFSIKQEIRRDEIERIWAESGAVYTLCQKYDISVKNMDLAANPEGVKSIYMEDGRERARNVLGHYSCDYIKDIDYVVDIVLDSLVDSIPEGNSGKTHSTLSSQERDSYMAKSIQDTLGTKDKIYVFAHTSHIGGILENLENSCEISDFGYELSLSEGKYKERF